MSGHTVRGLVVDHKESGVRYAVSAHNFNPKIHTKVRELLPGETVIGFRPKKKVTPSSKPVNTSPEPVATGGPVYKHRVQTSPTSGESRSSQYRGRKTTTNTKERTDN